MRYNDSGHSDLLIPTIYSEAKSMGAEELKVLAWHAYWMYQQKAENYSWMEKIEMDTPLLFEDPLLPRDINYKGMGIILILGCSEDGVNGEYYGVGKFPCKISIFTYTLYKKVKRGNMCVASGWDIDEASVFDQWTMIRHHKSKVGAKMRPPMSFIYRF